MLKIEFTTQFKRDLKKAKKRRKKLYILQEVIKIIAKEEMLDRKFKDHALIGNYTGFRELHLEADWLVIYELLPKAKRVIFVRTGTHSDLF